MGKRGQVTLFIIVGLVLISIVLILLYISSISKKVEEEPAASIQAEIVEEYVESCIRDNVYDALELVYSNGGYINPQNVIRPGYMSPVSVIAGKTSKINNKNSLNIIEEDVGDFIKNNFDKCLDIDNLKGYEIKKGELKDVKVLMRDNSLSVDLNYEIDILKGETFNLKKSFFVDVKTKLSKIDKVVSYIINEEVTDGLDYQEKINLRNPDWLNSNVLYGSEQEIIRLSSVYFNHKAYTIYVIKHLDDLNEFRFAVSNL